MTAVTLEGAEERLRWRDRHGIHTLLLALPVVGWVGGWLGTPYVLLFIQSFWRAGTFSIEHDLNLDSYRTAFSQDFYLDTLVKSIGIGLTVAVLATALAFPLAYFLAFKVKRRRMLLYTLVIVPLWASYLVRAYAWKIILGQNGVLNELLLRAGVIDEPISALLYSPTAVIITLTHIFTPFMVLTIYTTLERIPPALVEASKDLGVGRFETFRRVVLPLALPGVMAGGFFTLGLASGDFVAPILVGGPNGIMIANLIQSQFGATFNWPLGSALAFLMLGVVLVLIVASSQAEKREAI